MLTALRLSALGTMSTRKGAIATHSTRCGLERQLDRCAFQEFKQMKNGFDQINDTETLWHRPKCVQDNEARKREKSTSRPCDAVAVQLQPATCQCGVCQVACGMCHALSPNIHRKSTQEL